MNSAPLPVIDGVAPSYFWLPGGEWPDLYSFLRFRFPYLDEAVLNERLAKGELVDDAGVPVTADSPYRSGGRIWYYREAPPEIGVPFDEVILYRDDHLLAVDKPHFLAMIPAGNHLHETLLIRLRKKLALPGLTPVHRLDRETAGVVLFCLNPASRGAYQTLFERREVEKVYEAVAGFNPDLMLPLVYQSELIAADTFFAMKEGGGVPNSETHIELIARHGDNALYRLKPYTGRKHQLRVHMNSLGIPILNDPLYPDFLPQKSDDFGHPLQLLARSIAFVDPVSGMRRQFESKRELLAISR